MSFVRSILVASVVGLGGLSGACSSSSGGTNIGAGSDGGVASLCASKCARSNAANCGDQATCESECVTQVAAVPSSCKPQLDSLATCATTATYTCVAGHAEACRAQIDVVNACIEAAPPTTGGTGGTGGSGATGGTSGGSGGSGATGGTSGGSGGTGGSGGVLIDPSLVCTTDASDDPCFACDQVNCCSELKACAGSRACSQAYLCATTCVAGDNNCLANCVASLPPELLAVSACQNSKCATQCQ